MTGLEKLKVRNFRNKKKKFPSTVSMCRNFFFFFRQDKSGVKASRMCSSKNEMYTHGVNVVDLCMGGRGQLYG